MREVLIKNEILLTQSSLRKYCFKNLFDEWSFAYDKWSRTYYLIS